MKIKDVIKMANMMEKGNVLEPELAMFFLDRFDGMIQSDVMNYAPEEIVHYTDQEQELILQRPHDGLYVDLLVAMIRQQQQEYEGYNNAQAVVNEKLRTFKRWYIQHYRPADTNSRSYSGGTSADAFGFAYLTAYGLAVKHGYSGTEEEWLHSLEGQPGAAGAPAWMRFDGERSVIQWGVGNEWYDLFTIEELKDPVVEELMAQVRALAEAAAGSEAAAKGHAKTAADAAGDALTSAGQANDAAQRAKRAAQGTAALVSDAKTAADTAGNYAKRAEDAAERAEEAASGAGGGGIAEETDPTVPKWAKQPEKPTYTANEVGADPEGTAGNAVKGHDSDRNAHEDMREQLQKLADEKLDAENLPDAINTALAQAKANGEFDGKDGEDGTTPHIGDNGNWWIGNTDTGIKAQGPAGAAGRGIKSNARTSGNGAAGTTDTYTITYTDGTTSTYQVRNGANGEPGPAYELTPDDKAAITAAVIEGLPKYAGEVTYV